MRNKTRIVTKHRIYEYEFKYNEHYLNVFSNYSGSFLHCKFFETKEDAMKLLKKLERMR